MRHKIGLIFIIMLIAMLCATVFVACNGKYEMQDFVVDFEEFAKTYEVGDEVDLTKIKLSAKFSDGSVQEIPLDKVTITVDGVEISLNELSKITETTGTKVIEIKYSNIKRSVQITVNEKHVAVLTGIEFDSTNVRKTYDIGDTVSFEGLVIKAVYDGYDKRTIALTDPNLKIFMDELEDITGNLSRITEDDGEKTITFRYYTQPSTESFVIVVSDVLDNVAITIPSTLKTNYRVNDQVLFSAITAAANYRSGLAIPVSVKYYDGTTEITDLNTLTATPGTKNITAKATYEDKNDSKPIAIQVETYVESIELVTDAVVLTYSATQPVSIANFAGILINVSYAGTTGEQIALTAEGVECVYSNDQAVVFENITNSPGTKVITVKYGGQTDTFSVIVTELDTDLESLTISSQPTVTAYTAGASGVSLDGLVITAVYKEDWIADDVIAYADFAANDVTIYYNDTPVTDLDNLTHISTVGANNVALSINYKNKAVVCNLTITNNITALEIVSAPTKVNYLLEEDFDTTGLSVKIVKNYGEEAVAINNLSFFDGETDVTSNKNALTATASNSKVVKLKYQGQETTFNITVLDYVVKVELGGIKSYEIDVNKTPGSKFTAFEGLSVIATYKSGAVVNNVPSTDYTVEGNDITTTGRKKLTISCGGVAATKTIEIDNGPDEDPTIQIVPDKVTLVVRDILNSIEIDPTTIPTKIVKSGEVEKFLIKLRVLGNYESKGQEVINLLQSDEQSFLYGVVGFELKVGTEYQEVYQTDLNTIAAEAGNRDLKLNYTFNGYVRSAEFTITILARGSSVSQFALPQSLVRYNDTRANGAAHSIDDGSVAFEGSLYVSDDDEYIVGNDNPYRFVPTLSQIDMDNQTYNVLSRFEANSTIYLVGGTKESPTYTALTGTATGTYTKEWRQGETLYVTETTNENKYQFSADAENKKFKISVLPDANVFDYNPLSITAVEWVVKVVNGYNIYDSREICLLEQPSARTYNNGRNFWDSIKTELGLTGVRPSSIILHDSLVVTKDALPQDFWFTLPSNYPVYYRYGEDIYRPEDVPASLGGPLERSFLWDEEWGLLQFDMKNGESFSIHGNFFDIDLSKLPLVCSFEPTGLTYPDGRDAYYMDWMSKISFLDVRGYDVRYNDDGTGHNGNTWRYLSDLGETPTEDDAHDEHFYFDNFMVKGNAPPQQLLLDESTRMLEGEPDNPVYGGGIIFVKTHYCHSELYNINANSCFISFFSRDYTVSHYNKLKSYDTYLNAVYVNGEADVTLTDCHFKRAGGPLMIITQQTDDLSYDQNGNDEYIEIPKLVADSDCVLENLVSGREVWFDIFAKGQVSALAALDGLLNYYFQKTFFEPESQKFNLICVSSQGEGYFEYKYNKNGTDDKSDDTGDKMHRVPYGPQSSQDIAGTTTYNAVQAFNGLNAPVFTVGDILAGLGSTGGSNPNYYLQNASQVELSQEEGRPTISEFKGSHKYVTIHVPGANLGIFTGLYDYTPQS